MDIPATSALSGASALQALLLSHGTPASQTAALTSMVGQDLELLLQAILPDSVQLQLPSGQSILAQGQLPYPQGTQLRVRILPAMGETGVRLQTLEARPPSSPSLLAPLLQGEASSLLNSLAQADPPQELLPLIQLMSLLSEEPPAFVPPQIQASSTQPLPSAPQLETSLASIPQGLLTDLGRVLGSRQEAFLQQTTEETSSNRAVATQPENWEAWMRGSMKALGDPSASPREAPFHIAQSKEGTGFFEVPLPWSQGGNMQIWVESDPPEAGPVQGEHIQRVLLGLNFSRLGETRLGLAKGPFGLQVRIWAEHSELLQSERERMEAELKTLGPSVDLQIQPLPEGTPSLRALVTGPSLHALG